MKGLRHLNPSGRFPSGNVRYYMGPKGTKRLPMPDLPADHPRFIAAWVKAAEAFGLTDATPRRPLVQGTISAELTLYLASDAFLSLAPSTRAVRRRMLDALSTTYGHGTIRTLEPAHVEKDLAKFSGHARNNRRRAWRGFGMWLKDSMRLDRDPTLGVARAKVAKSDGHVPWSREDVEAFRDRWPLETVERLAFELIHWTGARVSDAVRLGEGHEDRDGWLVFRQQKTRSEVSVPYRRELPEFAESHAPDLALLHAAVAARPVRHLTFLHTARGASRSPKAVSQWFAKKARAAGLEARTAHGLRKTRAIALAEAGGTSHQIAAWTGHDSLKEVEHYTEKANRRRVLTRTKRDPEVPTSPAEFQHRPENGAVSDG